MTGARLIFGKDQKTQGVSNFEMGKRFDADLTNPLHCQLLFGVHWKEYYDKALAEKDNPEKPGKPLKVVEVDRKNRTVTLG